MSHKRENGSFFHFYVSYPWRKHENSYVFMNHTFSIHFNVINSM